MKKRALHSTVSGPAAKPVSRTIITTEILHKFIDGWIIDGEIRQQSSQTTAIRRIVSNKLKWFLEHKQCSVVGTAELRLFLSYLTNGHAEDGGRWGMTQCKKPPRPATVKTYHAHLCVLFKWIVAEGELDISPMDRVPPPRVPVDQVLPFTEAQTEALFAAARKSNHPRRDEAILLLLFDTGMRISELCGLTRDAIDMTSKSCRVIGKGNKARTLYFGRSTTRAIWVYLREEALDDPASDKPIFISDRGTRAGDGLTRSGALQLITRLGIAAGLDAVRCSPHTFRHTFAVAFLRGGGNVFALKEILGHTDLKMTQKYVSFVQADVEKQHRQYSPVDRLKGRK